MFTVFTIGTEGMRSMQSTKSDTFVVGEWKAASMVLPPATALTKALSDCGIKLRLRKEPAYVVHPRYSSPMSNPFPASARPIPLTGLRVNQQEALLESSEQYPRMVLFLEVLSQSDQRLSCTVPTLGFQPSAKALRAASSTSLSQMHTIFQFLTPLRLCSLFTHQHQGLALTPDPLTPACPC